MRVCGFVCGLDRIYQDCVVHAEMFGERVLSIFRGVGHFEFRISNFECKFRILRK